MIFQLAAVRGIRQTEPALIRGSFKKGQIESVFLNSGIFTLEDVCCTNLRVYSACGQSSDMAMERVGRQPLR